MVEITKDANILLLDLNEDNKEKISKISNENLKISQIDLITNIDQFQKVKDFSSYDAILFNATINWLEVTDFLEKISISNPSIAKVVFNNQPVTITKNIDSVIGNLSDNLSNFSEIIIFALERASERQKYDELFRDYKLLIDTTPIGFFRSTEDGHLLLFNPALIELFEFENEEEMSKVQVKDLYFDPEKRKKVLETFRSKGYYASQEEKMKKKNGEPFWVSMTARAIYDRNNNLEYFEGSLIDITKLKQAQEEIQKSEVLYRAIFEVSGTAMAIADIEGNLKLVNSNFEQLVGFSKDEIEKKMNWGIFVHEEERERVRKLVQNGAPNYETKMIDKNGKMKNLLVYRALIPNTHEGIASIIDITDAKAIEIELLDSEERFHKAKEISQAGEFEYNFETKEVHISQEIIQVLNIEPVFEGLEDEDLLRFIHPEDRIRVFEHISQAMKENLPIALDFKVLSSSDSEKYAYMTAEIIETESKVPQKIIGMIQDITERRKAEKELQEQEMRFKQIFDSSNDCIILHDLEGNIIEVNKKVPIQFGYTKEELLTLKISQLHPVSEYETSRKSFEQIQKDGYTSFETEFKKKDGTLFPSEVSSSMFSFEGNVIIQGVMRDISERRKAEKDLKESEEKYRSIFEYAIDGFALIETDGTIIDANESTLKKYGYEKSDVIGKNIREINPYEDSEEAENLLKQIVEKKHLAYETTAKKKDGTLFPIEASLDLIQFEDRNIIFSINRDITARLSAEKELRVSEEKYRKLFDNANDAIFLLDFSDPNQIGRIINANEIACIRYGYSQEEFQTMHPRDITATEYHSQIPIIFKRLESANKITFELENLTKEGQRFPVEISTHKFKLGDKDVLLSVVRDFTERKQAEKDLMESEERYRKLVETSPDSITLTDLEGNVLFGNEQSINLLGMESLEELQKMDILEFILPEDREETLKYMQRIVEEDITLTTEFTTLTKQGQKIPTESSVSLLKNQAGIPQGFIGVVRDISERKKSEQEIREAFAQIEKNLEQFAVLVDSIRNPLAVIVGLVDHYGEEEKEIAIKHANLIDDIISHIDERTMESEEVRQFLKKHFD